MKITTLLFILFLPVISHAVTDDIGFKFEETFSGYICFDAWNPQDCDSRIATDKLSIYFFISKPSANKFFKELDLIMDVSGMVYWNNEAYQIIPGTYVIVDKADNLKKIYYYYQFRYLDSSKHLYQINIQKLFFQDHQDETMWEDLTTMFVSRKEIFKNGVSIPAGSGVIKLDRDPFTLSEWIENLKSTNGTMSDDLDIKIMALDYIVFDRFNKVYNGHPI